MVKLIIISSLDYQYHLHQNVSRSCILGRAAAIDWFYQAILAREMPDTLETAPVPSAIQKTMVCFGVLAIFNFESS